MESAWEPISTPEGSFCVTYSLGAASARGNIPFSQLFERADTALYQAKRKGKNGFVYSTEKEAVNTPPRESQPVPVEGNAAFVQLLQQSQGPALWKIVWEQADGMERMEKMLQAIEEGAEEPADWQLYQQTVEKSWQAFARQELPGYLCIPLPAAFWPIHWQWIHCWSTCAGPGWYRSGSSGRSRWTGGALSTKSW